jgi:hypothetical protein
LRADLDAIFATQLASVALSPDEIAAYLIQTDDAIVEKQKLLVSLEAEDKRVQGEMERIMRLFHREMLSDEAVGAQYQPLFDRAKQLQDQIPAFQGELGFASCPPLRLVVCGAESLGDLLASTVLDRAPALFGNHDLWRRLPTLQIGVGFVQSFVEDRDDHLCLGRSEMGGDPVKPGQHVGRNLDVHELGFFPTTLSASG